MGFLLGVFHPSDRIQRGPHRVGTSLSVAAHAKTGCLRFQGGSGRRALNTNQMKAVPAGAWEQGVAPRACGWVTLYNYNTVVKASEPRWWRAGDAGFPSAQLFSALNGLVLFGLELTVMCVFQTSPPLPPFVLSPWPECLLKGQRGSQLGRENHEVAIIQTRKRIIGVCILLGSRGN